MIVGRKDIGDNEDSSADGYWNSRILEKLSQILGR